MPQPRGSRGRARAAARRSGACASRSSRSRCAARGSRRARGRASAGARAGPRRRSCPSRWSAAIPSSKSSTRVSPPSVSSVARARPTAQAGTRSDELDRPRRRSPQRPAARAGSTAARRRSASASGRSLPLLDLGAERAQDREQRVVARVAVVADRVPVLGLDAVQVRELGERVARGHQGASSSSWRMPRTGICTQSGRLFAS